MLSMNSTKRYNVTICDAITIFAGKLSADLSQVVPADGDAPLAIIHEVAIPLLEISAGGP
jgi:hypothetical protein